MQRKTRQRTAIVDALKNNQNFISAQDLYERLEAAGEAVGLATVYRNLQDLAASHDVDVVRLEDSDVQLFRYCGNDQHHHHLVCRSCGTTEEISAADVEKWANEVAGRHGFSDVSHSLELYGLCAACQAKTQDSAS
ncbi:MAG: Fur family transcriptional regulator [Actinomycetaceae bacterium]|nr:transcriptional repressor [Arcanobacterium sp.]MDD7687371.1 Fur family transcriptional regulator [Actinomycetaceae bacterium]MDY5274140.1 Fur family transcriptional regulator [Arcanobacterium sp.]